MTGDRQVPVRAKPQGPSAPKSSSREPDPAFPSLHGRPPRGWVNDPNGCSCLDGRYHVFFQYNPAAPSHHAICWGHMSSEDLVHWRQEPVALVPRPDELDRFGCWSGCVVEDGGVPTAAYSAVADQSARSVVLLARSDAEMRTWRQGRTPVASIPRDPAITHARDPFVFEFDGHRYAIQGAGHAERPGAARILLYDCDDLNAWTELGPLLTIEDPIAARVAPARIWECPNLMPLGDRWVLIISLWSRIAGTDVLGGARYLVGDLEAHRGRPRFRPTAGGSLDDGPCFYAPHVLRQGGRTLMWGWAREHGRSQADIEAAGWAGTLTFARELSLDGGRLVTSPADELALLRGDVIDAHTPITARAFEVELGADAGAASLRLREGSAEHLLTELPRSRLPHVVRIFVDGSMIEIFTPGRAPLTLRAYPRPETAWALRVQHPEHATAWTLED
ncbi:MAG TPA: glycoside hydrolase family 32 protein [Microbacterium sp.]|nr:glycoside hydrolase family 32 protein [Microbacterium sp.]